MQRAGQKNIIGRLEIQPQSPDHRDAVPRGPHDRAILASHDGDKDKAVWLPLSQIEVEVEVKIRSGRSFGAAIVTMPEVLAIDKGLAGRSIPSNHGHNGCR